MGETRLTKEECISILRSTLSINHITSTTSSYKLTEIRAVAAGSTGHEFLEIGRGQQGVVFELFGTRYAFKREHPGIYSGLGNEYALHKAVCDAFDFYDDNTLVSINSQVKVPRVLGLIWPDQHPDQRDFWFWWWTLHRFPLGLTSIIALFVKKIYLS